MTLTDSEGVVRSISTNTVGEFRFEDVPVQQTYILQLRHKQYNFNPQIITPIKDLYQVNMIGQPIKIGGTSSF